MVNMASIVQSSRPAELVPGVRVHVSGQMLCDYRTGACYREATLAEKVSGKRATTCANPSGAFLWEAEMGRLVKCSLAKARIDRHGYCAGQYFGLGDPVWLYTAHCPYAGLVSGTVRAPNREDAALQIFDAIGRVKIMGVES